MRIQLRQIIIASVVAIAIFTSLVLIAIHNDWGSFAEALLSVMLAIIGGGGVITIILHPAVKRNYKEPFNVLGNYLNHKQVSPVVNEAQGKVEISHAESKQSFTATISDVNNEQCKPHGFFMALIDFSPLENWGSYFRNYVLEFEIIGVGLKTVHLEVKNAKFEKIIDKKISNVIEKQSVRCEISGYIKDVKEICFVVFTNDEYMQDISAGGQFTVENLYLKRV